MQSISITKQIKLLFDECSEIQTVMKEKTPELVAHIQETIEDWQSDLGASLNERAIVLSDWGTILSTSEELQSLYSKVVSLELLFFYNFRSEIPKSTQTRLFEWVSLHYQQREVKKEKELSLALFFASSINPFIRSLVPLCIDKQPDPYKLNSCNQNIFHYLLKYKETDLLISLMARGYTIDVDFALSLMEKHGITTLDTLIKTSALSLDTPLKDGMPLWFYLFKNRISNSIYTMVNDPLIDHILSHLHTLKTLNYQDTQGDTILDVIIDAYSSSENKYFLKYLKTALIAGVSVRKTPKERAFFASFCELAAESPIENTKFYLNLIENRLVLPGSKLFFDLLNEKGELSSKLQETYNLTLPQIDLLRQFAHTLSLFKLSFPLADKLLLKKELEDLLDKLQHEGLTEYDQMRDYLGTPFEKLLEREAEVDRWIASSRASGESFVLGTNIIKESSSCNCMTEEWIASEDLFLDTMSQALAKGYYDLDLKAFTERHPLNTPRNLTQTLPEGDANFFLLNGCLKV